MTSKLIISAPGRPLAQVKSLFAEAENEIVIFSPYIKVEVLSQILPNKNVSVTIITSWKISDMLFGASDLGLHPFCQERGVSLFLNNRIHLKAYLCDWGKCISGSANITNNGLGLSHNYNYELNSEQHALDKDTLFYLKSILHEATLVTDDLYLKFKKEVEGHAPLPTIKEIDIIGARENESNFLISSLPMSRDIHTLFEIYTRDLYSDDKALLECAIHDTVLYKIPLGLPESAFVAHVKEHFFSSNFISSLLDYIGIEGRYFGQVKEWIQNNCRDVPVSSRRDLTGNIQVLYKWIVDLSDGKYLVDRPNYSERIFKVK